MTQLTDLNMIRHHRVDYSAQIDRDGARRPRTSHILVGIVFLSALPLVMAFSPFGS